MKFVTHAAQQVQHRERGFVVERGGWFVCKQNRRLQRQGAGNRNPLALAARKLRRILPGLLFQAEPGEQFRNTLFGLLFRLPGHLESKRDVAGHGARVQQVQVLEDDADLPPGLPQCFAIEMREISTGHNNAAFIRLFDPADAAQQRALACTTEADDALDHAAGYREVDACKRLHRVAILRIYFTHILERKHHGSCVSRLQRSALKVRHRRFAGEGEFRTPRPALPCICPG